MELDRDGSVNLFNDLGSVNLIVDVLGYYAIAGSTGPLVAPTYSSTLVGPGQAGMYPVDVSNSAQYYFVLDAGNYRVIAVNRTTDAIDCQLGGLQGSGPGQFGDARALDYDSATGELYVADTPNNRIEVFSFSGTACASNSPTAFTFLSQFGTRGTGNEQFAQVYGVAVDAVNGWVYAVDGAGRVEKSDLAGNYISQFNAGGLSTSHVRSRSLQMVMFFSWTLATTSATCSMMRARCSSRSAVSERATGNSRTIRAVLR